MTFTRFTIRASIDAVLNGLESIRWSDLTHAFGSAEDVPVLIREVARWTPSSHEHDAEGSPLSQLFESICDQGTVFPATASAVPFLIELASDPRTAARAEILDLLSAIAQSRSFVSPFGEDAGHSLASVRATIAERSDALLKIAGEESDVRYAALAALVHAAAGDPAVSRCLLDRLAVEERPVFRSCAIWLLGALGADDERIVAALRNALASPHDEEQMAAVLSIASIASISLPADAHVFALRLMRGSIDKLVQQFPFHVSDAHGREHLLVARLDSASRAQLLDALIDSIETGAASHSVISALCDLSFARATKGSTPVRASSLTDVQTRALRVLATLWQPGHRNPTQNGRRVFAGSYLQWGLPDSRRDWNALASGRDPEPIDLSLPIIADPVDHRRAIRAIDLRGGQRFHHRSLGLGEVLAVRAAPGAVEVEARFEEEGPTTLRLPRT